MSMSVWCDGCGEEAPLDPIEVEGRGVLMVCERCYREHLDDRPDAGPRSDVLDEHARATTEHEVASPPAPGQSADPAEQADV